MATGGGYQRRPEEPLTDRRNNREEDLGTDFRTEQKRDKKLISVPVVPSVVTCNSSG